jgi:cyanophycinase
MNGLVVLVGSGEYLPVMNDTDRYLLANCGANAHTPRVVCLPTAAGQEGESSWGRWMRMGEEHFRALGAEVKSLPIIDRASADDSQYLEIIENADLIYFSGGNPFYLFETLNGSRAWEAAQKAWARGALYAGCSAGAMIMAEFIPNWRSLGGQRVKAFGALPKSTVFPHFDRMLVWRGLTMPILQSFILEGEYTLGIDEDTALVGKPGGEWKVMGRQKVYVITRNEVKSYAAGEKVPLPFQ